MVRAAYRRERSEQLLKASMVATQQGAFQQAANLGEPALLQPQNRCGSCAQQLVRKLVGRDKAHGGLAP